MPVVLGVLMLAQSHFTPTAAGMDGTQQKIMKYGMPFMFSFMMVLLPAGLVLYILVNTILTLFQNIIIRRQMA
jgi:YidC/Oxa1 family membrane protein insertase